MTGNGPKKKLVKLRHSHELLYLYINIVYYFFPFLFSACAFFKLIQSVDSVLIYLFLLYGSQNEWIRLFDVSSQNKLKITVSEQVRQCLQNVFYFSWQGKQLLWTVCFSHYFEFVWKLFFLYFFLSWHGLSEVVAFSMFCCIVGLMFLIISPLFSQLLPATVFPPPRRTSPLSNKFKYWLTSSMLVWSPVRLCVSVVSQSMHCKRARGYREANEPDFSLSQNMQWLYT